MFAAVRSSGPSATGEEAASRAASPETPETPLCFRKRGIRRKGRRRRASSAKVVTDQIGNSETDGNAIGGETGE